VTRLVILNKRQLRITRAWQHRFQRELEEARDNPAQLSPRLHRATLEALESQIADFKAEIAEFEKLGSVKPDALELGSLADLPELLVKMRVVRHLSQEELAAQLRVRAQQVQRWEAGGYRRATFHRLLQVADALQFDVGKGRVVSRHRKKTSRTP
jgi:DNA-binding transcriptional regulator YiaG